MARKEDSESMDRIIERTHVQGDKELKVARCQYVKRFAVTAQACTALYVKHCTTQARHNQACILRKTEVNPITQIWH